MKKIPRFIPSFTLRELVSALFSHKRTDGPNILQRFAEEFAKYIDVSFAVPAPSARIALAGLLHALELPKQGEVILPSLIFHVIPVIFKKFGLRVRFVDINPSTYCIDTNQLAEAITPSTVAIMPVHLYGRACNMDVIMDIAKKYNLVIIEDCAQGCGAWYAGKRLGSFGQGAIFSFHHHKNLPVLGCGMLVTNSRELAAKASSWMEQFPRMGIAALTKQVVYATGTYLVTRSLFWDNIMHPVLSLCNWIGFDLIELLTSESPISEERIGATAAFMPRLLHGRIGLAQLEKIDELNQKRIRNGDKLLEYLQDIPGLEVPAFAPERENIYTTFVVRVQNRQEFRRRMLNFGVDTHPGNMFVGPHLPGFQGRGNCEIAADAVRRMVHLPIYPQMGESDVVRVAKSVIAAVTAKDINNESFRKI